MRGPHPIHIHQRLVLIFQSHGFPWDPSWIYFTFCHQHNILQTTRNFENLHTKIAPKKTSRAPIAKKRKKQVMTVLSHKNIIDPSKFNMPHLKISPCFFCLKICTENLEFQHHLQVNHCQTLGVSNFPCLERHFGNLSGCFARLMQLTALKRHWRQGECILLTKRWERWKRGRTKGRFETKKTPLLGSYT